MNTEQRLQQLEDRIAIRELIDAYTYCADTRNIQGPSHHVFMAGLFHSLSVPLVVITVAR